MYIDVQSELRVLGKKKNHIQIIFWKDYQPFLIDTIWFFRFIAK